MFDAEFRDVPSALRQALEKMVERDVRNLVSESQNIDGMRQNALISYAASLGSVMILAKSMAKKAGISEGSK